MEKLYSYPTTVCTGNWYTNVRAEPTTSAPLSGSRKLSPGVCFEVVGYVYGECIEGECRWWKSKFGNYVWVGATIQKPPGLPREPETTEEKEKQESENRESYENLINPPRNEEYVAPTPIVSFSTLLDRPLLPGVTYEVRAFNVDDVARVYLDGSKILEVGYKGDKKVRIYPGLSVGKHNLKFELENKGGGWTYGFQILENGIPIWSKVEGKAGEEGARNNNLAIGKVVEIHLGLEVPIEDFKRQEADEWTQSLFEQITTESALSTVAYLTPEEAKRLKENLGVLGLPSKIFDVTVEGIHELMDNFMKKVGQAPFIFLAGTAPLVTETQIQQIWGEVAAKTGRMLPAPSAASLAAFKAKEVILAIGGIALTVIKGLHLAALFLWYGILAPYVGILQLVILIKNFSFFWNPEKRIRDIVNAARDTQIKKIDEVASKIDVVAQKIDVVRTDFEPLLRVAPRLEEIQENLSSIRTQIATTTSPIIRDVKSINEKIILLSSLVPAIQTSLLPVTKTLPEIRKSIETLRSEDLPREISKLSKTTWDIKTELLSNIPSRVLSHTLGRLSQFEYADPLIGTLMKVIGISVLLDYLYDLLPEEVKKDITLKPPFKAIAGWTYRMGMKADELLEPSPNVEENFADKLGKVWRMIAFGYFIQYVIGGMAAWWAAKKGASHMAAFFAPFASYRIINTRIITAFTRVALSRPLGYLLNSAFRTEIPALSYILTFERRRLLDPGQWELARKLYGENTLAPPSFEKLNVDHLLALRGFSPEISHLLKISSYRPLDPFSFAFLSQTGYFKPEEVDFLISDMGYRPEVREYLIKAPLMWGLSPFKTSIRHSLIRQVKEGYLTIDEVVKRIPEIWRTLDLSQIAELEAKTLYEEERKKDIVDAWGDKFTKGVIDEATLRGKIEPHFKNKERLEDYIFRLKVKKDRKVREETMPDQKRFILATLLDLYVAGLRTPETFVKDIEKVEKINNFTDLALFKGDLERELEAYKEAKRKAKEELRNQLGLIAGILVTEYSEGAITKDELLSRLEEAEKIKDRREAYIKKAEYERELEDYREKKKEEKEKTKDYLSTVASAIIEAYEEGAITKEDLERNLEIAEKITTKRAAYVLKAEWVKFLSDYKARKEAEAEELKNYLSLLASTIISCYRKGYLNTESFERAIEIASQLRTKKSAYILKGQWEIFETRMDKRIDNLTDSLDKGLITEGSFYNELIKMGVQEWKIEELIEEHEIKTFGKTLSIEAKLLAEYRACVGILNKIADAGFKTKEEVAREIGLLKTIVSPLELLRKRRTYEVFYDERKIRIQVLAEQYKNGLLSDARLHEELGKIIVVPEKLEKTFLEIVGAKKKE